jgi:hypothetical protein
MKTISHKNFKYLRINLTKEMIVFYKEIHKTLKEIEEDPKGWKEHYVH